MSEEMTGGDVSATNDAPLDTDVGAPVNETPAQRDRRIKIQYAENDEEEFDLDNPEDLDRFKVRAQHGKAANRKFSEVNEQIKAFESAIASAKGNPAEILKAFGLDPTEFAQSFLSRQFEEEQLTPEERRQREEQEELQNYRKMMEEQKKAEEEAASKQALAAKMDQIHTSLRDAMESFNDDLPEDPELQLEILQDAMKSLYNSRQYAYHHGLTPDLNPRRAVRQAIDQMNARAETFLKKLGASGAYERFSKDPDFLTKWREQDLARHKKAQAPSLTNSTNQTKSPPRPEGDRKKMGEREWLAEQRRKFLGE